MRLLFVAGRAHLPESFGGVQSSTDATIPMLQRMGHDAAVACALWGSGAKGFKARLGMKLRRRPFAKGHFNGYTVYRAWAPVEHIAAMARDFQPDVAIVQHQHTVPFATALQNAGFPIAVYLRNLEFEELSGDLRDLGSHVQYIANSRFTAAAYRKEFGIEAEFLPPLVDPGRYRTSGQGKTVTMINPGREKGIDVTLEMAARCPDIPFVLIEGWGMPDDLRKRIEAINARSGNITLQPKTSDMRAVYANARIVLAPSQWEEAWGRVASEAQVSGVPVIGSDRGGLPEAIGPGGIVVPADAPPEQWVAALRSLWDDEAAYNAASSAARGHADRDEMQPMGHARRLVEIAERAVALR